MLQAPSFLLTVLAFLLVLGPLVILHELGHYLVARWCGVRADAFSIGFGKELWGWTDRRGTRWRLSALPLGGYVQFAGDANAASMPDGAVHTAEDGTLAGAKLWKRALIVAAGPIANVLVAVMIFAAFNMAFGHPVSPPVIDEFSKNAPAQAAGMRLGDRIVAIDGEKVETFKDIAEHVMLYPGQTVTVTVRRAGSELSLPVKIQAYSETDRFGNVTQRGILGVASRHTEIQQVGPVRAVALAFEECGDLVKLIGTAIRQMVVGERSPREMSGMLQMAKVSGEQLSLGWLNFVQFVAFVSINLAFINLLPIPVLDGGHLALYAAEAIRRRPVSPRGQEWAFRTGLALVLALMVFATLNDLVQLRLFGS